MNELDDETIAETGSSRDDVRARIVAAATRLLDTGGRDALTTRAVATAADVQAPTIYRLFGDKSGLLDAVADQGFAAHLQDKAARLPSDDIFEDLRAGWDAHVAFGLGNPALYALMYGDPRPGVMSRAAMAADDILKAHVRRVAVSGHLRVSEEKAADLMRAAGRGTVLSLLAMREDRRDLSLSVSSREAVIAAITNAVPVVDRPGPAAAAVALRAALPDASVLSEGERALMAEWLDRLAAG